MTARRTTDNSKALEAFMTAKVKIDAMLARLVTLSNDHFDAHPDEVNWAHVGLLNHYAGLLRQITDSAFGEGDQLQRMGNGVRRCQDDHRPPGPPHPSLPHLGNRQRQLPFQGKLSCATRKKSDVTHALTPA